MPIPPRIDVAVLSSGNFLMRQMNMRLATQNKKQKNTPHQALEDLSQQHGNGLSGIEKRCLMYQTPIFLTISFI